VKLKRLPWPPWKLWGRVPAPARRRIHFGIDYGSCVSKIVFRDNGAPQDESAVLVVRNGTFRIPSRVCATATALFFGDDTRTRAGCDIYGSVKTRVATVAAVTTESTGGSRPPFGLSAADLAALTIWFLISEGHRAAAAHLNGRIERAEVGISVGVPMPIFNDERRRTPFLSVARQAWALYSNEGLLDSEFSIEDARRLLRKYPAQLPAIPDREVQEWVENRDIIAAKSPIDIIRPEDEAGLWWLLRSPSVRAGPYAKVDIGAATTHANLFRIFGPVKTVKRSVVRYGAIASAVGTGDMHRAAANGGQGFDRESPRVRDLEQPSLRANFERSDALMPLARQIYDTYQKAWNDACVKMHGNALEISSWRQQKLFVTGGGSRMPFLVDMLRTHPDGGEPLSLMALEPPFDLIRADRQKIASDELPFLSVAYGLSNMESYLPNPYNREPG
jgi:hypothetical protein